MKTCTLIAVLICAFAARAEDTFRELRWRSVGPYRGGRTKAAAGVPGKPGLFYVGAVNGGVWRTDDFGRTWTPIFDDQPTGSIGAIAVAPSNPRSEEHTSELQSPCNLVCRLLLEKKKKKKHTKSTC